MKDITVADQNDAENPDDEAEAAAIKTVDLSNPDIDWSQLNVGIGSAPRRAPAGRKRGEPCRTAPTSSWSSKRQSQWRGGGVGQAIADRRSGIPASAPT